MSKLMSTPFLNETKNYLINAVDNPSKLKYVLNVDSDTLMQALLYQLGMNNEKIAIPFASGIFIELYKNKTSISTDKFDNHYVKIFLNDPNNAVKHTLKDFIALINNVTYDKSEFNYYCHEYNAVNKEESSKTIPLIVCIITLILVMAIDRKSVV